jgi:hypothetical protein
MANRLLGRRKTKPACGKQASSPMAIATSTLHRGFRGATGDFLFRTYNGKTVVSLRPVYRNETNTEARRIARDRFREATFFASEVTQRTKEKAYYTQKARQLKLPNAYTAAITDYLRKAKARAVTRSSFVGRKGEVLYIVMMKYPFAVNRVTARLCDGQGKILAEQSLSRIMDRNVFRLTLMDDLPDLASLRIINDEYRDDIEYVIRVNEILRVPDLKAG